MAVILPMAPKMRQPHTHKQRVNALNQIIPELPLIGISNAWLVGSLARGDDTTLSDVDLIVDGLYDLAQLYSVRDRVYALTGVIINFQR